MVARVGDKMPAVVLNDLPHSGHWKPNEGWFLQGDGLGLHCRSAGLPLLVRGVET